MMEQPPPQDQLSDAIMANQLKRAIRHMVANISKSFIVEWYTSISPTNHDFVASCETLIEAALTKLAEICLQKLDKYKIGQLVTSLLHDHILNDTIPEKVQSIKNQIEEHEYDICQNSVVRLFGLLCTEELRQVIFTQDYNPPITTTSPPSYGSSSSRGSQQTDSEGDSGQAARTETTSALYTLVIAMLTKAVFMPIVSSISEPNWLYAVIIWLCKKEEREKAKREESNRKSMETLNQFSNQSQHNHNQQQQQHDGSGKFYGQQFMNNDARIKLIGQQNPKITVTSTTRGYRSLEVEEGIDMASGNINFENPVCDSLKRPLDNIEIYATEEVKSNNSCYILYCIRYEGLCHRHPSASGVGAYGGFNFIPENSELPIIDKRATANTRLMSHELSCSNTIGASSSSTRGRGGQNITDSSGRKTFRKKMTIKRRFREFVILQLRLEENPKIRPYMKNIPKPTKLKAATQSIFSLPGITNFKLDQSTIRLRQRFLERFLIALNNSPFIANSYEFKEFFSYNLNSATINMNKSKSLILQVNFNKVLVDSVRSALSIIRSTMPSEDVSNLGSNSNPDAWLIELQQRTLKLHVQTRTSHSKMNLERYIDSKLLTLSDSSSSRYGTSYLDRATNYETNEFNPFTHLHGAGGSGGATSSSSSSYMISGGGGGVSGHRHPQHQLVKSHSTQSSNTNSSSLFVSRSSSSNSHPLDTSSRSTSTESVYHDASSFLANQSTATPPTQLGGEQQQCNSSKQPQVCDSVPIASKLIDIMHYSISKDSTCSNSSINFMARMALGKMIERHAVRLLENLLNLKNATLCLDGITSSIWEESDDPPLDLENASLDEAVKHLTKLLEENYVNYSFIPKQLLNLLIGKQIRFYLSQLVSQERNKFVIYSFFVHLLDELEI